MTDPPVKKMLKIVDNCLSDEDSDSSSAEMKVPEDFVNDSVNKSSVEN